MEKTSQLKLAGFVVLLLIASSGLQRGAEADESFLCRNDKDCRKVCELPGGKCSEDRICECPGSKFAGLMRGTEARGMRSEDVGAPEGTPGIGDQCKLDLDCVPLCVGRMDKYPPVCNYGWCWCRG